jgi:hypothetical protein
MMKQTSRSSNGGIRYGVSRCGVHVSLALCALLLFGFLQTASAIGTFVPASNRVDMVYDDVRGVLYITEGDKVLRYDVEFGTFLDPFVLGGSLLGVDISPDGNMLMVADESYSESEVWVHLVDLRTEQSKKVLFPRAFYEGGTFTVAFGGDGAALITTDFLGSGWVPLRKYDPGTNMVTTLCTVRQNTMLRASADGSVIGFAESNESDGPFGYYRIADGTLLRKTGYTDGTGWFNYEIGVNRNGTQYAIPTYDGTFITDVNLAKINRVGVYAGAQPIGVVYHPRKDIVYFPWATTTKVYAYDATTLTKIAEYDFEDGFVTTGNWAFRQGRMKMSRDGHLLFATVQGGVRFVNLNHPPTANGQALTTLEDTPKTFLLSAIDVDGDPLQYTITDGPVYGELTGTAPNLTYTPIPNYNGTDQFTFKVSDGLSDSSPVTVSVSISAVNDAPSFTLAGSNVAVKSSTGKQSISGWARNISAGPSNEASQAIDFVVTNSNPQLFLSQPVISPQGTLTFTPAKSKKGTATGTVYAHDNGGTDNGGVNHSSPLSFTISVK